jgi:hypothetical protein
LNGPGPRPALPRRDWLLLPLVAAVTALACLVLAEGASRVVWPENKVDHCVRRDGSQLPLANCVTYEKAAEGPLVETRFNECGYRATGSCRALEPGTARMAVLGSSTSWGYLIPFGDVWSVQAAAAITAKCGRPIDVQNLGGFGNIAQVAARAPEALELRPQLVAFVVNPFDLFEAAQPEFNPPAAPLRHVRQRSRLDLMASAKSLMSYSRAILMAQHYIFSNPETYATTYLHYGDKADFLRVPLSSAWRTRLDLLDAGVGRVAAQLRPSGTSLLVVYAPQEAQADLIATGQIVPGVDPFAIDKAIAKIATRHGALFADGAQAFLRVKDAPDYYYRADGHLNGLGQALLGRTAAQTILAAPPSSLCPSVAR